MTMRSCFYPLIGDRIFSWIGDFIDVVAVISTMFGVCTSLGLGAKQLNQGLAGMFSQVNDFYRYVKDKIQLNSIIVEKMVDANLSTILDFSTI